MLSGDNGVLQRATDAKEQTEIGQEKEIVALAYNSALAKKVGNGDSTAVTVGELNTELSNQGASASGSSPITVTFDASKRQYTINNNGIIDYLGIKTDVPLNIGDVVTNYKSSTELPEGVNWIYFGKDKNGNKLLTTSKPIENGISISTSADSWLYSCMQPSDTDYEEHKEELNEYNNLHLACKKYEGIAETTNGIARSITMEDINNVVGFDANNITFNEYTFISGNTNDFMNNKVNYFFPDFRGKSRTDYPYYAKAGETLNGNYIPMKNFSCNYYSYYESGDNECIVKYQGVNTTIEKKTMELLNSNNMKWIKGIDNDFSYVVASRSVNIYDSGTRCLLLFSICRNGILPRNRVL